MKYYFYSFILLFSLGIVHNTKAQSSKLSNKELAALVKEAYIYGYPVEQSYRSYVNPTPAGYTEQSDRIYNHFTFSGKLATAANDNKAKVAAYVVTRNRGGAGPNNDTPYFGSLLDLSNGPVVLSVPYFGDRYYSFHFINFYNRNIKYIGSSFGDTTAGKYLLIGPDWKGNIPAGLKAVRLSDNRINLVGRVLVEDDSTDINNIVALQRQTSLTPLAKWPAEEGKYPGDVHNELPQFQHPIDSFFVNLNRALALSPSPAYDQPVLNKLKALGIGTKAGFQWKNYNTATQKLIHNTMVATDSLLDAEAASGDADFGNGWQRTNPKIGNWGTDYWNEALYIKHGFYAGHDEAECIYIIPKSREGHGFFKGDKKYKIHFAKDAFPPKGKKGFWSMTAYEIPGYFLLSNPIHRAAIRDRTKNIKYNADGSLDIYLQAESPGADKESNWLPISTKESTVTFRIYLPKASVLKYQYKLPVIQTVD